MRKILLLFCLGLVTSISLYAQNPHCVQSDLIPGFPVFDVMCFVDNTLSDGDEIELTEAQFNDDAFLQTLIIDMSSNCDMGAVAEPRRVRRLRENTSNSRSSGGRILGTITFVVVPTDPLNPSAACDGKSLSLMVRCPADPIPTLSQWGLMIFGLLVLNIGSIFISKNQTILTYS